MTDVGLSVAPGESVALMGPSGSGKTSLLRAITGLVETPTGRIMVGEDEMTGRPAEGRARLRRSLIGMAHQDPDLLPELSVIDNVAITMLFDRVPIAKARGIAQATLNALGIGALAERDTSAISGGQAQRVALARAVARPGIRVLVADEPTASLDGDNAVTVAQLIRERTRELGLASLVATHDTRVADVCDRVVHLGG
ncbi:MAG: ATP-binding cassette domain-containing protein [Propionibacteriaceae bacterium]|nr:ATP-binding cassette domain-containing protein [Propionibacteriaceae bacterium]